MIKPNMPLSGFKTLLQFFAYLQAFTQANTRLLVLLTSFLRFSVQQSHIDISHGQHLWLLCLDRPSWESWGSMWCTKAVEMHLQGDFPWDPALTIVLGFVGVTLQEQENKSKGKILPMKLWPGQFEWCCRAASEKQATKLQMKSPLHYTG